MHERRSFLQSYESTKHLVIIESEYDNLFETISENEPDLTIIDISELEINKIRADIENILKNFEETKITLLLKNKQEAEYRSLLEELKTQQIIYDYGLIENNYNINLVKLVLPIMKPTLRSDESLENVGMVADLLGIPFVSNLIDSYVSGREIKETIYNSEDELSISDKALVISDLASILGLDKVSSVLGLIVDISMILNRLSRLKWAATN